MAGPWDKYGGGEAQAEAGPWAKYGPATLNPNLAAQGAATESARDVLRTGAEMVSQRDPGIDYRSGVPNAMLRAGFSRMSNDEEKAKFLDSRVGKGAWAKDSFGAYVINPEGMARLGIKAEMPVALDEQVTTRYDVADWAGDAPAVAGAVGGGLAATGLGAIPGMALAGLGAAGGKAIDEIVKNVAGDQVNTAGGVAKDIAKEGALGGLGEGIVRALTPIGKFLMGPGASRMTPEKKALAESAQQQGFAVKPGSVTDAPILARWEGMVEKIFGDLTREQNEGAAKAGIERLTKAAGPAATKEEAGTVLKTAIRKERMAFSSVMEQQYGKIDELVGGVPIVPTGPLKEQAEAILGQMAKTGDGKVVGGKDAVLRDVLAMGDAITVKQAQRLRTMFREASESPDLVPDISMHDAGMLKRAVESSFDAAKTSGGANKEAINRLRTADQMYAQGIRRFDNPVVAQLTRDASRPGAIDADMVVDYLVKPERLVRLREVKNIVGQQDWARVKAAHAQELLSSTSKGTADPLKTIFDGKAFRDTLDKYGRDVLTEVHGKQWVDDAYRYANALMIANKRASLSGGIVAANVALHPIVNMPKLLWLRGLAKVMEQPGTFKYLTEGIQLGPTSKAGAETISRVLSQAATLVGDETGSARVTLTEPKSPQR